MKKTVYIETSVVSYLVSKPSINIITAARQSSTHEMWKILNSVDVYISDLVLQEASSGDKQEAKKRCAILDEFQILPINDDVKTLANALLKAKALPEKCPEDALHIAVAAVYSIDIIVTWNFKHINNPFTRMVIRQVIENNNYQCPELCSPDEFLGDER